MKSQESKAEEKGVTVLSASVHINKSPEEVWETVKHLEDIQKFHPLIKSSCMTTENKSGNESQRLCKLKPMGEMHERISNWKELYGFTTEVIDGKSLPPYVFMKGDLSLSSKDSGTLVTFTFSYKLKYGWMGRVLNTVFIKSQFKKAPGKYVNGLKEYLMR